MEHTGRRGGLLMVASNIVIAVLAVLAVLAGLVVLVLLVPAHSVDTIPPQCFAVIGYGVPCDDTLARAASIATAVAVGVGLWMRRRSR